MRARDDEGIRAALRRHQGALLNGDGAAEHERVLRLDIAQESDVLRAEQLAVALQLSGAGLDDAVGRHDRVNEHRHADERRADGHGNGQACHRIAERRINADRDGRLARHDRGHGGQGSHLLRLELRSGGMVAEILDNHGVNACILHGMQIGKGAVDDLRHIPAVIHRAGQCQRVDHADDAFLFQ